MASVSFPLAGPLDRGEQDAPPGDGRHLCSPGAATPAVGGGSPFLLAFSVLLLGVAAVSYQIAVGIGTWGLNRSVGWAFDITNFVFWIGIGHAGTLISAILFLFRQKWRTSVNRSAEAMTIFAVMCAGLFPVIHMGRPWLFYWIIPYPNGRGPLVGQFPLAAGVGLLRHQHLFPDLAGLLVRGPDSRPGHAARPGPSRLVSPLRGLLQPGLERVVPHVAALRSRLPACWPAWPRRWSFRFTPWSAPTSPPPCLPGWHSTIFPPYFVTGAIFSGMAMVLTLMLMVRKIMHLEDYITPRHVDAMTKLVLATSCLVGLAYAIEFFTAFYGGNPYESFTFLNRALGPLGWGFAIMVACNVLIPQLFWFRRVRRQLLAGFCDLRPGQRRHVDGAVCHHRHLAGARFPAVQLDRLRADLDRAGHACSAASACSSPASCSSAASCR